MKISRVTMFVLPYPSVVACRVIHQEEWYGRTVFGCPAPVYPDPATIVRDRPHSDAFSVSVPEMRMFAA